MTVHYYGSDSQYGLPPWDVVVYADHVYRSGHTIHINGSKEQRLHRRAGPLPDRGWRKLPQLLAIANPDTEIFNLAHYCPGEEPDPEDFIPRHLSRRVGMIRIERPATHEVFWIGQCANCGRVYWADGGVAKGAK